MPEPDTNCLIRMAQDGDAVAQQALLIRHRDKLRLMVCAYLDPRLSARIDPSDVLQEALVCAAGRLPNYLKNQPIAFYPWLRQIVRDELINIHRRHVQAQRRTVSREWQLGSGINDASAMVLADRLIGNESSPSQKFLVGERKELVKAALSELSESDRELLLMRCVEQLEVSEIVEILSISESAVRSRLRRGLQKLGRHLGLDS